MIPLLFDENVPLTSAQQMLERGFDVQQVAELMPGATDTAVIRYARENGRVIVTFDRDYGDLAFRRHLPSPAGVVYLRFSPASPEEPALFLERLLVRRDLTVEGQFTVVDRRRIRQRPLASRA